MNVQIWLAPLPSMCQLTAANRHCALVIDALRFTTTAAQAFQAGAKSIRVVQDISAARQLAALSPGDFKLCGERECRPIPGFDLGNSPLEYTEETVGGADLIFSTTNGTRAVEATDGFGDCLLGAFVNRTAVASAIARNQIQQWQIVCSGTDGEISGEDMLAAGSIIAAISEFSGVQCMNDSATLSLQMWNSYQAAQSYDLQSLLEEFHGGSNLAQAGYEADIEFAAQIDRLTVVPARGHHGAFVRLDS